ncbi:hypothetical protein O181_033821 [Austropuccinia psidii MF-1]|uniref:Uncharacterized protein n=1 Tax=Austropuccinia psidii MF-1 TaxID=1389203 RepID=A0A9Q3D558_9BASI|nr:hypothetical protein [Austropuccinia psidii MF-1]
MCHHFSSQTRYSPQGDRKGVAFTSFQYKQHIKKLISAIEPKCLPNIPTLASGFECPKIILNQIFPADYSQLTHRTFSTPIGLRSTAQKSYSSSQKLPPQDLVMIISAILSLRYNIPCRAAHIVNPPETADQVHYLKLRWSPHSHIPYTAPSQYHIETSPIVATD